MKRSLSIVLFVCVLILSVFSSNQERTLLSYNLSETQAKTAASVKGRPSVALVLSGAGAKGLSYIPILEALEKNGIPIDKVYGTSMGSLMGGLYCAGYSPKDIYNVCKNNDLAGLFTELTSSGYKEITGAFSYNSDNIGSITLDHNIGGSPGVIDDYKILNLFEKCIGNIPEDIDFDKDLVIPFECNATDMITGREVIFSEGSLITAMRSSMSIPAVFEPVHTETHPVLMDGGIVCNSMIHRARLEGFDIVICVTVAGYEDQDFDPSLYETLPGSYEGYMLVSFRAVTMALAPLSDYWIGVDVNKYGILEFGKVDEIVGCGKTFLEDYPDFISGIASLFTEDQKVYKNPDRTGEYFTKYPEREKKIHVSTKEKRNVDFLGRSRLAFGAYGSIGLGFDFKNSSDRIRRALYPTFRLRAFFRDIGGTPLNLDTRAKATLGTTYAFSSELQFCLNPDGDERFYLTAGANATLGSLTSFTDITQSESKNEIEYYASPRVGVLMTNGRDNILRVFGSIENNWAYFDGLDRTHRLIPSANIDFVYYPKYETGIFHMEGGRLDVLGRLGYDSDNSSLVYKIGFEGQNSFRFSQALSLWVETTAFTSREPLALRDSYGDYGGWRGMPGYSYGTFCTDFITGGVGIKWMLLKGVISDYISVIIRGGIRSSHIYGIRGEEYESKTPFSDCFSSGIWDLGISVGYGVSTPVGDVVIGAGFNKDMKLALYFELV